MNANNIFLKRRQALATRMGGGVAIVTTAPERIRNRDTHYLYRFDSYFYYLSGFREPEAVLVVVGGAKAKSVLFCRDKDVEREIWDGFRYGPAGAQEAFGFDEAYSISRIDEVMPGLIADQPSIFCRIGHEAAWDTRVLAWLNQVRGEARKGVMAPRTLQDLAALVDEMRVTKDEGELAVMRQAARISTAAHRRAMHAARPDGNEAEVEAELLYEFRRNGAQAPAYSPIVAAGQNACVLHYVQNDAPLRDGDLLLIDAGCEMDGYASDITRTFPVNGRFSGAQRAVYEIVLAAQSAAIEKVRPGNTWNEPHEAAVRVLAQGLIDLGLVQGGLDAVIENEAYKKFYMHRTGHWLGLDVHDAGDYKVDGKWREFKPGMVLTVEPGCYIRAGEGVPERFADIGIRIEDDVVVTAGGCEVLTNDAPKKIADIEAWMRER
jgi:Xaa-Pro aminopeptidase